MKLLRYFLGAAFALALAAPLPKPAQAATVYMCQGDVSGASTGSRTVTVTSSTASPQPTYVLNSAGCASVAGADVGFFLSQGFVNNANGFAVVATGITNTSSPSPAQVTLPANSYITGIIIENTTATSVTGGVKVGTTSGGTQVVANFQCLASCLTSVTDALILRRVFSTTTPQTLFIDGVTALSGAILNVTVTYQLF